MFAYLKSPLQKKSLDLSTLLGIIITFSIILIAITFAGNLIAFIDLPSLMIVLIGTFSVTIACFSLKEVLRAIPSIFHMLFFCIDEPNEAALRSLQLAEIAKKRGLLALEKESHLKKYDGFLRRGILLAIDGIPVDQIERILTQEIISSMEQNFKVTSILRKAAELAPAMGLIGTLIGLVQMLGNLNDPTKIGPSMAISLLTTFYGALLAYIIFFPLASKMERNSKEEVLISKIYLKTILSIAKKESPYYLETVLNSLLTPRYNIKYLS